MEEEFQKAVALLYEKDKDVAPKVIAKGYGEIAEKIISLARKHKIPIWGDKNLVELLMKLDMGECIPPKLYKVIAEILVFIYRIEKSKSKEFLSR